MLPHINGKKLQDCTEDDLSVLLENENYRENEYIDFKRTFSFLEAGSVKERKDKKAEFKSDICAFANADGGYLIYGIGDKKGCASHIEGIDISNNDTDKFELDRRNDLNGIQPKIPQLKFSFIRLKSGKYVVVIYIRHDEFAPYVHVEDEKNYRIYRRYGNGKRTISYSELRQMFYSSLSLEQAISEYTNKRIENYRSLDGEPGAQFVHLMMIPENFLDYGYRQNAFVLEKTGKVSFGGVFQAFGCDPVSIPCVDGIKFVSYRNNYFKSEGYVKNNGIVEAYMSLTNQIDRYRDEYPDGFLACENLWDRLNEMCRMYTKVFNTLYTGERIFICLSIVGCRNVTTEGKEYGFGYIGQIDRETVICDPIELLKIDDENEFEMVMKKLRISYYLAIGVKHNKVLTTLIDEVYGTE